MKIIKVISEKIEEQLDCAEWYIKKAIKTRNEFPDISKTFYNLSIGRMENIKTLHDQVVTLIKNYQSTEGDPPASMMAIYEYVHEKEINKTLGVKKLQDMYKEGSI